MSGQFLTPLPSTLGQTTTEQVFSTLYDAVISLALPPGTKVSEIEIAKQLDVSRQPVRDAFFRMSNLGFLAIRPQRATLITKISEGAVRDAAFIRTAIEVECVRHAMAKLRPEGSAALNESLERQTAALDGTDPGIFHAEDEAFHALICELAGQRHAWQLIQEQKAHMDRVRFLTLSTDRRRVVWAEHKDIVDAIHQGDEVGAEQALRKHLGSFMNVLKKVRQSYPDYFEQER